MEVKTTDQMQTEFDSLIKTQAFETLVKGTETVFGRAQSLMQSTAVDKSWFAQAGAVLFSVAILGGMIALIEIVDNQ